MSTQPTTTAPTFDESQPGFPQQMVEYYKPPVKPSEVINPDPNNPHITSDTLGQENLNFFIDYGMIAANAELWREYSGAVHHWNVTEGDGALPHPPRYKTVNAAKFWTWWADYNANVSDGQNAPAPAFFEDWTPPPAPKIVTKLHIPPAVPISGPVGDAIVAGEYYKATPIGAMFPVGMPIPFPQSDTGFLSHQRYSTPFMPAPFDYWMACPAPFPAS